MLVGIPKEIKKSEFRVAAIPAGVKTLCETGHKVFVERRAGEGSGFSDEEFKKAGAEIIKDKKNSPPCYPEDAPGYEERVCNSGCSS